MCGAKCGETRHRGGRFLNSGVLKLVICILEIIISESKLLTEDQSPTICGYFVIGVAPLCSESTSTDTEETC